MEHTLAARITTYCQAKCLSMGGLAQALEELGELTPAMVAKLVSYCEANALLLDGMVLELRVMADQLKHPKVNKMCEDFGVARQVALALLVKYNWSYDEAIIELCSYN